MGRWGDGEMGRWGDGEMGRRVFIGMKIYNLNGHQLTNIGNF